MYKTVVSQGTTEVKQIKADRKLLQQLFSASLSGRKIEMQNVLQHELSPLPLSLVSTDGTMRSTTKSDMLTILTTDRGIHVPKVVPDASVHQASYVVIDGHALIQKIGKVKNCDTFNQYGDKFVEVVLSHFDAATKQVDVLFDRYLHGFIKDATWQKHTSKSKRPICRIIGDGCTPMPLVRGTFLSLGENKAAWAKFLSETLLSCRKDL